MAIQIPKSGGSGRDTPTALSEINVTPFVDVMLVLLIIFMVTAPLLQHGVGVDLPRAEATPLSNTPAQINLVIDKSQKISIDGQPIAPGSLQDRLDRIASTRPDVALYIQADKDLPYGFVAQVLATVRRTAIQKVGLVTEPVPAPKL
jgi:biopolymer transport protein TolR